MFFPKKNIRLKNYDYTGAGAYFITINTKLKKPHFGEIDSGVMILSEVGEVAESCLKDVPGYYLNIKIDEYVIMPDHIHFIVIIEPSQVMAVPGPLRQFSKPVSLSVSVIVQQFKASVKRWCNCNGYDYFEWHRRFYDKIIWDDKALASIRKYIKDNPANWEK